MRTVRVTQTLPATVYEIEQRWYDTSRWTVWVEGLRRVVHVSEGWPRVGSSVTWDSGPAGRGHVVERVVAHEPLAGQTVEVDDSSITGRQSVAFVPVDDGVEVQLTLSYEIKNRSMFTPVVDALFIKRAMATSLATTLGRFGAEMGSRRAPLH
ncbi:MAG: SRPBCC family protein [Solirubrobacterales bacterium]